MSGAGKGDTYRKVDVNKFNARYEVIFGKKEEIDFQKGKRYIEHGKTSLENK